MRSLFSDRNSLYRIKIPEPLEVLVKIQTIGLEKCNIPRFVVTYEIILTYSDNIFYFIVPFNLCVYRI